MQVLDAALEIVDELGIAGLTMRTLGQRLGVNPMVPYRLFPTRAALIDALADREALRLARPREQIEDDPLDRVVGAARHIRAVLLEHPNLAPVVIGRPLSRTAPVGSLSAALETFTNLGVPSERVGPLVAAAFNYGFGFVLYETSIGDGRPKGQDMVDDRAQLIRALESSPELNDEVAMLRYVLTNQFSDEQFELGMRAIVHGILAADPDH